MISSILLRDIIQIIVKNAFSICQRIFSMRQEQEEIQNCLGCSFKQFLLLLQVRELKVLPDKSAFEFPVKVYEHLVVLTLINAAR